MAQRRHGPGYEQIRHAAPEDLEDILADDPEFERRFDAMLPGKRRNAIHQIASAKPPETAAKRILKLMKSLGI